MIAKGTFVVLTTEFRGVFYGQLEEDMAEIPKEVSLLNAKNCIYWNSSINGVFGLAVDGPSEDCKIGAEVKKLVLIKITSISICTDNAIKAWKNHKNK